PNCDPGVRRGRGGRGAVRVLSARMPRPLRGRLRALRRLHGEGQPRRRGGRAGLSRGDREPTRQLRGFPGRGRGVTAARAAPTGPRAGGGMTDATPVELMTIAGSRLLRDGGVVFAGVGAPLEASVLAKRLHAPSLTIVLEKGSIR